MRIIYDQSAAISAWVAQRVRRGAEKRGFAPCTAIGIADDKELIGGMVFHNWSPESGVMEISCAGDDARWLHPALLKATDDYLQEIDVNTVIAWTPLEMTRWRRLLKLLGAEDHPIEPLGKSLMVLPRARWERSRLRRIHGRT